jgi:hypothetical protein
MTALSDSELRRYLLGRLSEESASALERRYFGDSTLSDEIAEAEHDLVDDYVAGRLTSGERADFESRYLTTPDRRLRVATAAALRDIARRESPGVTLEPLRSAAATTRIRRAPGGRWLLGLRPATWAWMSAAAAILMSIGLWLLFAARPQPAPQRAEAPRAPTAGRESAGPVPPAPVPAPSSEAPGRSATPRSPMVTGGQTSVALLLSPVLTRSDAAPPTLAVPAGTNLVELRLLSEQSALVDVPVDVRSVDGGAVWTGRSGRPPAGIEPGVAAVVTVPTGRLPPDDYILTLSAGTGPPLAQYYFRIAPRR